MVNISPVCFGRVFPLMTRRSRWLFTLGFLSAARPHGEIEGRHAARVACGHLRLGLQKKLRSREVTRKNTWDVWRLAVNVGQVGWAENLGKPNG